MANIIGFWGVREQYGKFSNWYKCKFEYNGITFNSSEQALMYMKAITFKNDDIAQEILGTSNQKMIKELGRKVTNYDEKVWGSVRYGIMVDILKCKFEQNESLRDLLLSTGSAEIYEASPNDRIWGIGSKDVNDIRGQNLLGKALMEVRESLKS